MKKLFPSIMLILSLLAMAVEPSAIALATDDNQATSEVWLRDDKILFAPSWISPKSGSLDGTFNSNTRFDIGIKQACFFTYDEEQITQKQLETEINNFQSATWVQGKLCQNFQPEHWQGMLMSLSTEKVLLNHRSGVFYYVFNLERWGEEGADWVWGKIDHHECSYNGDTDPHMSSPCYWGGDVDKNIFLLLRSGDQPTAEYVPWVEEWSEDLAGRIAGFETEIAAWNGDKQEQEEILDRLEHTKKLTADANDAQTLDTQYQELIDKFKQKIATLTPTEPSEPEQPSVTPPTQPTVPVEPEQPEDNKEPKPNHPNQTGTSARPGANIVPKPDDQPKTDKDMDDLASNTNVATPNPDKIPNTTLVAKTEKTEVRAKKVAEDAQKHENLGSSNSGAEQENENTDEIEVPVLRAREAGESGRWWLWLVLPVVLLIGMASWWCKRAFFGKTSAHSQK